MHSKWDNLGYLKDQKGKIFWELCPLDPHQGSALHSLGGTQSIPPPKPPNSKVLALLAVMYLFFSGLIHACGGMSGVLSVMFLSGQTFC